MRQVWQAFGSVKAPLWSKDFILKAMWGVLPVYARIFPFTGTPPCPLCGKQDTTQHALLECTLFPFVFDLPRKSWQLLQDQVGAPMGAAALKAWQHAPEL